MLSHSAVSDSLQSHVLEPTRLPRPWDPPGKNTGVGCHFLLRCMKVKSEREVTQSCPTLSDPMDCSPPGSSIHGISRQEYWSGVPLPSPLASIVSHKKLKMTNKQNKILKVSSLFYKVIQQIRLEGPPRPLKDTKAKILSETQWNRKPTQWCIIQFSFFYKYLLKVCYLSHSVLYIWNKRVGNTELITALKEFKNQKEGQTSNYNREC